MGCRREGGGEGGRVRRGQSKYSVEGVREGVERDMQYRAVH